MAENKTQPTAASVEDYIKAIANEARRDDCRTLVQLMSTVTKAPPIMWGPGIVGFGNYHYTYASGREGDMPIAAFASRKGDISVYLTPSQPGLEALLARLGKHKMGKCCLYIKRLADIDLKVLRQLVVDSITETRRQYG